MAHQMDLSPPVHLSRIAQLFVLINTSQFVDGPTLVTERSCANKPRSVSRQERASACLPLGVTAARKVPLFGVDEMLLAVESYFQWRRHSSGIFNEFQSCRHLLLHSNRRLLKEHQAPLDNVARVELN